GRVDAGAARRGSPAIPDRAPAGRRGGRRHARARVARSSGGGGVSDQRRGRVQRVLRVHHAPVLRRTFPSAGRLVARVERAGAPARIDRPLARAWPTLHRERRQRRAATRSRSARGLHDLGRRARHRLDPACRLRREDSGLEDSPRRVAPLSRRSAGVGLLSLPPWLPRATLLAGAALALALAITPPGLEAT